MTRTFDNVETTNDSYNVGLPLEEAILELIPAIKKEYPEIKNIHVNSVLVRVIAEYMIHQCRDIFEETGEIPIDHMISELFRCLEHTIGGLAHQMVLDKLKELEQMQDKETKDGSVSSFITALTKDSERLDS